MDENWKKYNQWLLDTSRYIKFSGKMNKSNDRFITICRVCGYEMVSITLKYKDTVDSFERYDIEHYKRNHPFEYSVINRGEYT